MFGYMRRVNLDTLKNQKVTILHSRYPAIEPLEGQFVLDAGPDSLGTALDIGSLIGQRAVSGFVGNTNKIDVYRLTLIAPGTLNVRLNGLSANADLRVVHDINNNLVVDRGEILGYSSNGGTNPEVVDLPWLAAGNNYYVQVYKYANTNYKLTLTSDYAGNIMAGTVTSAHSKAGSLRLRRQHRHRGLLPVPPVSNRQVDRPTRRPECRREPAGASSGEGTVIARSINVGILPKFIDLPSLTADTYYVRVNQNGIFDTNYNLTLMSEYPGNSTSAAWNICTLNGRKAYSDFVGSIDSRDYYRFSLSATGRLNVQLDGQSADADLQVLNSAGTVIARSTNGDTTPKVIDLASLGSGTYYALVYQYSGNTNYNLTLTSDYAQ